MSGPDGYLTLLKPAQDEYNVQKSRFLCDAAPCATEEEALAFLQDKRTRYRDATHHCYAYVIGRNAGIMRFSDDGEPSGTAGMPMMDVVRRRQVVNCCVVVTRYFGGILLGAGGLVRAYSRSACDAADAAGLLSMEPCTTFSLRVPYPYRNAVWGVFDRFGVLEHADYAESIDCTFRCRTSLADAFLKALTERTEARVSAAPCGEGYYGFPVAEGEENG